MLRRDSQELSILGVWRTEQIAIELKNRNFGLYSFHVCFEFHALMKQVNLKCLSVLWAYSEIALENKNCIIVKKKKSPWDCVRNKNSKLVQNGWKIKKQYNCTGIALEN